MGADHISKQFKLRHRWTDNIKNQKLWYWLKNNGHTYRSFGELFGMTHIRVANIITRKTEPSLYEALMMKYVSKGEIPITSFCRDMQKDARTYLTRALNELKQPNNLITRNGK